MPRRQGTCCQAQGGYGLFCHAGLLLSGDTSRWRRMGAWSGTPYAFLDPLYSSGVLLALRSGEMAADAIVEGLRSGDTSAEQLGKWGTDVQQGRRSDAAAGLRVLRRLQFRQIREEVSSSHGPADLLIGDLFTDRVDTVWGPLEHVS